MKRLKMLCAIFIIAALAVPSLAAQSLNGMSLNGSTGLYSIPSGKTGWEQTSSFGFDLGYHTIISGGEAAHIPKLSLSLFKWVELSAAFDIQPGDHYGVSENGTDFIGGMKIQFPLRRTALALGGNFQALNLGEEDHGYIGGQVYAAVTYAGDFFGMPAETTMVLGKTMIQEVPGWDIDFGMGFDLLVLPNLLDGFIHWIVDFANFSYGVEAFGAFAETRGVFNSGLRIDISAIPALSRFKFIVDILITDAFDDDRAFSLGAVFGVPVL